MFWKDLVIEIEGKLRSEVLMTINIIFFLSLSPLGCISL